MPTIALLKSLSILVGIIALIYACFYFYKKRAGLISPSQQRVTVLERRVIDQKTTINLVRVDERELVIISHPNNIAIHAISENVVTRSFRDVTMAKNTVQ